MSRFLSPLRFQDDNGLPFTLTDPLRYQSDGLGCIVEAPTGMHTDLASIPQPLWNILPPVGAYDPDAVLHDSCYQYGCIVTTADGYLRKLRKLTRKEADGVLRESMVTSGVPAWKRFVIWSAVRVGGGRIWDRYRAKDAAVAV